MNLYDIILAGKVNGGGGGGGTSASPILYDNGTFLPSEFGADFFSEIETSVSVIGSATTASGFATMTIPAPPIGGVADVGLLRFSLMGQIVAIAIYRVTTGGDNNIIAGGTVDTDGAVGAVFCAKYQSGVQGVTVLQAGQITNGTYTDITAYMSAATNISITWYGPKVKP